MEKIKYAIVLDKKLSDTLCDHGFPYIIQKINNNDVYAFEITDKFNEAIEFAYKDDYYDPEVLYVDNIINF